jgi:hypothetical protein
MFLVALAFAEAQAKAGRIYPALAALLYCGIFFQHVTFEVALPFLSTKKIWSSI